MCVCWNNHPIKRKPQVFEHFKSLRTFFSLSFFFNIPKLFVDSLTLNQYKCIEISSFAIWTAFFWTINNAMQWHRTLKSLNLTDKMLLTASVNELIWNGSVIGTSASVDLLWTECLPWIFDASAVANLFYFYNCVPSGFMVN